MHSCAAVVFMRVVTDGFSFRSACVSVCHHTCGGTSLLPQPQHISHTIHPGPLLHHPTCSPHSPTRKRLPACCGPGAVPQYAHHHQRTTQHGPLPHRRPLQHEYRSHRPLAQVPAAQHITDNLRRLHRSTTRCVLLLIVVGLDDLHIKPLTPES